jgi:hypothetical protein
MRATEMLRATKMLRAIGRVAFALAVAGLAGCSDGDDPAPLLPSGEGLARDLIANGTTDSADPIDVNGLNLEFSEDPDAFADFFQ